MKKFISLFLIFLLLVSSLPQQTYAEELINEDVEPEIIAEDTYVLQDVILPFTTGRLSTYGTRELVQDFTLPYTVPVTFDFSGSSSGNYRLHIYNEQDDIVWSTGDYDNISYKQTKQVAELTAGTYKFKLTSGSSAFQYALSVSYTRTFTTSDPMFYLTPNPEDTVIENNEPVAFTVCAMPASASIPTVEWTVSDPEVASVSNTGVVSALKTGTATLSARIGTTVLSHNLELLVPVYSELENFTLEKSKTKTLKITVTPDSYPLGTVTWNSSNTKVAKVSSSGKVTAVAPGTAAITASVNGQTFSCTVTVIEKYVESEVFLPTTEGYLNCYYGTTELTGSMYLPYTVPVDFNFDGSIYGKYRIYIYNANTGKLVWSTDSINTSGISYTENQSVTLSKGSYEYKVTAGTTTSLDYKLKISYSKTFTNQEPLYYLTPSPTEYFIYKDEPLTLKVKAKPGSAVIPKITWSVNNTKIATINSSGKITAKKTGTVKVTAKFGDQKLSYEYRCIAPTYTKLKDFSLYEDETKTLKVTVSPKGYPMSKITWKSSNTKVAKVSSSGKVTALKPGTATISATVNGTTLKCKITVKKMTINNTSKTVYTADTYTLKVNGGSGKVTWKSSNSKIAKVSSKGVVTGVKPGSCTITAKKDGKTFKCKITVKWPPETGITKTKNFNLTHGASAKTYKFTLHAKSTVTITSKINSGTDSLYLTLSNTESYTDVYSKFSYLADGKITKKLTLSAGTYHLYYDTSNDTDISLKITTKPAIYSTSGRNTVAKGYSLQLKTAGVKNSGTWSSSNTSIATVSSSGKVTGKSKGSATIYCKLKDGTKISYKVKVVDPVTVSYSISNDYIYDDANLKFTNYTNKEIDYIEFQIYQYDYKGRRLESPYDYFYCDVNIKANSNLDRTYWINENSSSCKITIYEVRFTDGKYWRP